jgi:membrane protein CcdC involved in cytochrome C biogenesis
MTDDVDRLISKRLLSETEPAVNDAFVATIQSRVRAERWVGRGVAIFVQLGASFAVCLFAWLVLRVGAPHWISPPELPMLSGLTHLVAFGIVLLVANLLASVNQLISSD